MHAMDEVTGGAVKGERCPKANFFLKLVTLSDTSSAAERALARVRLAASRALASTSSPSLLPNSACVMLPKKPRSFCNHRQQHRHARRVTKRCLSALLPARSCRLAGSSACATLPHALSCC